MWKNIVERGRPQLTVWRMRIIRWILKATYTHSGCVILIAFPLQQWLHERFLLLRYTYIACLVALFNPLRFGESVYRRLLREQLSLHGDCLHSN